MVWIRFVVCVCVFASLLGSDTKPACVCVCVDSCCLGPYPTTQLTACHHCLRHFGMRNEAANASATSCNRTCRHFCTFPLRKRFSSPVRNSTFKLWLIYIFWNTQICGDIITRRQKSRSRFFPLLLLSLTLSCSTGAIDLWVDCASIIEFMGTAHSVTSECQRKSDSWRITRQIPREESNLHRDKVLDSAQ